MCHVFVETCVISLVVVHIHDGLPHFQTSFFDFVGSNTKSLAARSDVT